MELSLLKSSLKSLIWFWVIPNGCVGGGGGEDEEGVCVWRGGGGGGGGEGGWCVDTHYISIGKDVLTKGILFSESVWTGPCFIVKNLERNSNIPVKKEIHVCLERGSPW